MKKFLLLTFIVACGAVSVLQGQTCPQIVLQNNQIKAMSKTRCDITIPDPGHTQYNYDFIWIDSIGGTHNVNCLSGFHYKPKYIPNDPAHPDESRSYSSFGIVSDVVPGHPLYGIKDKTVFYMRKHCYPQSSLTDCYSDTITSPISPPYQINFK